jgi:hypothetical protein
VAERPIDLHGKGWYVWAFEDVEKADANNIASVIKAGNYTHLVVKIANGTKPYYGSGAMGAVDWPDKLIPLIRDKVPGIKILGFQYVYGNNPLEEALMAISRCKELEIDAFVVDAEGEYKQPGMDANAKTYMSSLRLGISTPILLASYRYPSLHPQLPWASFRQNCDGDMPQVYWELAHNPDQQLQDSYNEFRSMNPQLPYFATGSAYSKPTIWAASKADVVKFMQKANELNVEAVNFWEWGRTKLYNTSVFQPISDYPWPEPPPPPPPPPGGEMEPVISGAKFTIDQEQKVSLYSEEITEGYLEVQATGLYAAPGPVSANLAVELFDGKTLGLEVCDPFKAWVRFSTKVTLPPGTKLKATFWDVHPGDILRFVYYGIKLP